eukprot:gnl/MRDRNA2_/MRDRNA2_92960_c0_seq1.p1 gnl/MRDRNA2_/MRDRNA2_92960_c0~~gnl/MRDRNA2_/MRDRNA2_92960_c0_seq1.p1  ORF type:complete len:124 (-),score=23.53 gnl/MRDRNA2_/MRDRNA2_92960_c0_seq1:69-440(-)
MADAQGWISAQLSGRDPKAVSSLVSDMKMVVAYETAADWQEPKAMQNAFEGVSWEDPSVAAAMPRYLSATGADRAKVDYAFNAMIPRPADPKDVKQTMMHTWLKARLFSYNALYPFDFNPYSK